VGLSDCVHLTALTKGHVENKVGYLRRNFLVPVPTVASVEQWNKELLELAERDFQRPHYKKGLPIAELFEQERRHLGPLPERAFNVERFNRVHTDGYGKFCLDGRHWYSSAPELAGRELTVGLRAHAVHVYREDGSLLCAHRRLFGESRSDSVDYFTSLEALVKKPGAWPNSALRVGLAEGTREALDGLAKPDLRRVLAVMSKSATAFGFDVAVASLEEALRRGALDGYSLQAVSARIAFDGLQSQADSAFDLRAYDQAFIAASGDQR
jgi:hypothetical protein